MAAFGGLPAEAFLSVMVKADPIVRIQPLADGLSTMPTPEPQEHAAPEILDSEESTPHDAQDFFLTSSAPLNKARTSDSAGGYPVGAHSRHIRKSSSHDVLKCEDDLAMHAGTQKKGTRMRLPSFRGLGIASSDPSYLSQHWPSMRDRSRMSSPIQTGSLTRTLSSRVQTLSSPRLEPRFGATPLLTPPEDVDSIRWNNALLQPPQLAPQEGTSSKMTDSSQGVNRTSFEDSNEAISSENVSQHICTEMDASSTASDRTPTPSNPHGSSEHGGTTTWLDEAVNAAVSAIDGEAQSHSISIVAQVLPRPVDGSSSSAGVFTTLIQGIQGRFEGGRQPYITITHAVPPKFDLHSLPTSPPATPNLPHMGEDYFSQSIFAHAAVAPSYHAASGGLLTSTPSSPNPIVPPASVEVSLLERYIPPSNADEYKDLLSSTGHSVLVDRLSELSPFKGTLMFIYPTRKGAQTFVNKHLSPILDPILMNIINLNDLQYGLAEAIGRMKAVSTMQNYANLRTKIISLCSSMTRRTSPGGRGSTFSLVYSCTGEAALESAVWKEWFVLQEQERIKDVLNAYWQLARRLPTDKDVTAMTIARQIVDGIRRVPAMGEEGAGEGVEVGVFIVRRDTPSA